MRLLPLLVAGAVVGALAAVAVSPAVASTQPTPLIIGGSTASGNNSWAAALLYSDGTEACTGSLIAPQWVITAGHCLSDVSKVRLGSSDYTSGGTLLGVSQKVSGSKDIALLKLSKAVSYKPIKIAPTAPKPGDAIRLMGWGVTCDQGCDPPHNLKALNTTVVADSKCSSDHVDGPTELCVNVSRTQTACYGDSGGPALVRGLLVGADDRGGNHCGDSGGEIYKDVTAYRSWIAQNAGV